jgi:hypothetical protein
MKNSIYEEKDMKSGLRDLHTKIVEDMGLPNWVKSLRCPHCTKKIESNGIREISICLNARNIGDLSVEYHCHSCGVGDTLYFRKAVEKKISDFSKYLKNDEKPSAEPVVEEEMYKIGYNNLVEKFLEVQTNGNDKERTL